MSDRGTTKRLLSLAEAPALPHDALCALIKRAQDGDEEARKLAVAANMRFVLMKAQALGRPDMLEELVQAGVAGISDTSPSGLMRAIETFDTTSGMQFTTYAYPWIRYAFQQMMRARDSAGLAGCHAHGRRKDVRPYINRLVALLGRQPTIDEVVTEIEAATERAATRWDRLAIKIALADTVHEVEFTSEFGDGFGEGPLVDAIDMRRALKALEKLPAVERDVIKRRLGLEGREPETLAEIATSHGRPKDWVRRCEVRAFKSLRAVMGVGARA